MIREKAAFSIKIDEDASIESLQIKVVALLIVLIVCCSSSETNSMVEEFMLLANIYTARKIFEEFPQFAVLRRHPAPPVSNFEPLVKVAQDKVIGQSYFNSGY